MLPESSTTFSAGQPSEERVVNTTGRNPLSPLFEYGTLLRGGVDQKSSYETSTTSPNLIKQSLTEQVSGPVVPKNTVVPPRLRIASAGSSPRLKTRQLWYGVVTEVEDNGFVATLTDKTNPQNPDEQVMLEFDSAEISPDDLGLVTPGSTFYWTIGTEVTVARQVKNVSMLQFRRTPPWTEQSLARVKNNTQRLKELFGQ